MKVLLAEDDRLTREGLSDLFTREGFQVVAAPDGREAINLFLAERPDVVCLDIMMPHTDGFTVCREIRARDPEVPILFISAKGEEIDKVLGLELGADDFIVKPFGVREVVARIRAVTRRCLRRQPVADESEERFTFGDLEVFPRELRARRGTGPAIDLSLRDVQLLALFRANPGRVLTRLEIFQRVWGEEHIPSSRTLDQHISQLRKRIERDPRDPVLITTVHGAGYRHDGPA